MPVGADGKPSWKHARAVCDLSDATPPVAHGGALFSPPPATLLTAASHQTWQQEARTQLGEGIEVTVFLSGPITGAPFETDGDFRIRLEQAAREQRDEAVRRLRDKFAAKTKSASQKVARAQEAVARQQSQARAAQMQTAISVGTSVLGALFGKKASGLGHLSRAGTAARGATRAMKESSDVGTAQERLTAALEEAAALEAELEDHIAHLTPPAPAPPETLRLKLVPATLRLESSGILWTA